MLLDCLALLVHSGQVLPLMPPARVTRRPAHRFNRMIVGHARTGRIYSPSRLAGRPHRRAGLGFRPAGAGGRLRRQGTRTSQAAARHAMSILKMLGRRPMREGRLIEDDGEATIFLAESMQPILARHSAVAPARRDLRYRP